MDVGEPSTSEETASTKSRIYEATLGSRGAVIKGRSITRMEAESRRRAGHDIVVCGPDIKMNRRLAGMIERNANGQTAVPHAPHRRSGPFTLPHWQPFSRPPDGHSFYETPNRKAF
jgi:hypothetical protein